MLLTTTSHAIRFLYFNWRIIALQNCVGFWQTSGFPCGSACNARGLGLIPGLGRSPGEGKGYPLQYSGLENSMDCIVHGVTKSGTWLKGFHFSAKHQHESAIDVYMYAVRFDSWGDGTQWNLVMCLRSQGYVVDLDGTPECSVWKVFITYDPHIWLESWTKYCTEWEESALKTEANALLTWWSACLSLLPRIWNTCPTSSLSIEILPFKTCDWPWNLPSPKLYQYLTSAHIPPRIYPLICKSEFHGSFSQQRFEYFYVE